MSNPCAEYRPAIGRCVEGETTPAEALQLARHLSDCTACRIVLAREIRLVRMLDGLDDSIAVEEGFLRTVMRSLPAGPPPASNARRGGLKLAGFSGALALAVAGAWRLAAFLAGRHAPLVPRWEFPDVERLLEALGGVAGVVWAVLDRVGAHTLFEAPVLHLDSRIGATVVLPAMVSLLALSTLVGVIARGRCRS